MDDTIVKKIHCRYFLSFSIDTTVVPVYRATLSQRAAQKRGVGWGEQSTFAFKATCNKTVCYKQSCFWQGKKCVVLHYHWEILTKVYFRFFIKTLKNHIDLWKWASDDPFNKAFVSFYLTTLTFSTEMREKVRNAKYKRAVLRIVSYKPDQWDTKLQFTFFS